MNTSVSLIHLNTEYLEYGIVSSLIYQCNNKQKKTVYDILNRFNEETRLHSIRTALMMKNFLEETDIIDKKNREYYIIGMLLHDTGKLYIPIKILEKKGKLKEKEMCFVKKHTKYGYDYLKLFGFNEFILDIVKNHHERINGKGYYGLNGNEISEISKIAAIIDVFDAVTHLRCYNQRALSLEEAIDLLINDEGLDKKYCEIFVEFIKNNKENVL